MRILIKEMRALIEDSGKVPLHDLLQRVAGALGMFDYMVKGTDPMKGKAQLGIWSKQTAEVKPSIMRIFDRLDYHIISPWREKALQVGMALWKAAGKPKPTAESQSRAKKVFTTVPKMPLAVRSPLAELHRAERGLTELLAREGENAEVDALLSGAAQILPMVTKAIAEIESL